MAFATASSPANRKPGATRKPQHHPKRKRDRVNRQGTPNPLRAPEPQHAPEPARAHQAPSACQAPSTPEPASACQNPQRTPEPQRAPGRKPGSGALTEPSIGLRDVNRAEQRVPRAVAEPSSEFPLRRIVNFVQLRSKLTILRSLKAKTHDYLRYREAHARTTDKNVHFSLPRPRKTVCFDRQRPKPTVFRIAHPPRQPNPMLNKQHSRHRSRRWRASSPGLRTLITGIGFYHHRDWSGVTIPEFCRILDAFLRH